MNQNLRKKARLASYLGRALKPLFAVCALATGFATHHACAQQIFYWDAGNTGGSGNWDVGTVNWSTVPLPANATHQWTQGNIAVFSAPASTGYNVALTGGTNIQTGGITFSTGTTAATGYNITSTGPSLVFVGAAVVTAGAGIVGTISAPLGTDPVNNATDTLTFTGGGTVQLSANNSNYSVSMVEIEGGITVRTTVASALPNAITVVGDGQTGGTLDLYGTAQSIVSLNGDSSGTVTNSNATAYANLTVGASTGLITPTTYAGVITDSNGAAPTSATIETTNNVGPHGSLGLTVVGPGTSYNLTLTGTSNNYTGMTTVGNGTNPATLRAGAAGVFSPNSVVNVLANGTLDLNGFNQTIAALNGTGAGTVTNTAFNTTAILTVGNTNLPTGVANALNSNATLQDYTINNGILGLTKIGGYTQVLSGTSTYSGPTVVSAGVLTAGSATALSANSAYTVNGTLDLNGYSASATSLQGSGTLTNGIVGDTTSGTGAATFTTGSDNSNTTFSGLITDGSSGALTLAKTGGGVMILTDGANSYSGGTQINQGTISFATGALGTTGTVEFTGNSILQWNGTNTQDISDRITIDAGVTAFFDTNGNNVAFASGLTTGALSGLDKFGAGTLTLGGTNTYNGATTVSGGTLQAGTATGFSSASAFTVANLATLDVNGLAPTIGSLAGAGTVTNSNATAGTLITGMDGTSTNFMGTLQNGTGTLALTKIGGGTQTLSGTSTYGGATMVNAGTLQAGSATGFSANSAFTVAGKLDVNGFNPTVGSLTGGGTVTNSSATAGSLMVGALGTSTAFTGNLVDGAGDLGLTKTGAGALTLSGDNSYSGATTISAGTLQAGAATGFSANSAFTVTSPGALDINGLAPTIGSLAGSGTVTNSNAAAGTLITGNDNTSTSFTGTLQNGAGTLALTKIGTGILTLGSANTYSGGTTLQAGALVVANSAALGRGNVTVNGGSLQAGGTYTNIQVGENYTQGSGGELDLRIGGTTAGTYDRLTVTGSATLSGKLTVNSINGYTPKIGQMIPVIATGAGVNGQFASVTGNLFSFPTVKLTVNYTASQVILDFQQGSFSNLPMPGAPAEPPVPLTPNEKAVAFALDHVSVNGASARLLSALDSLPITGLLGAYNLIAPTEFGTIYDISRSGATMEAVSVTNRLDEVHASSSGAGAAGPAGPVDDKGSKEVMPPPEYRLGTFVNGSGEFVSVGDTLNAPGYNFGSGAVTAGVDYRFTEHFVAGVLFNYTRTDADLYSAGRLEANAFRSGVYASLFGNGAYVNGFVGGAYNTYDMNRAGFGSFAHGDTDGGDFNALISTGFDAHAGGFTYGPVASFQYTYTGLNSFNETGSLDPLHINSGHGDSLLTNFGARATYEWHIGTMVLVPEVRATWQHEYGDVFDEVSATMLFGSPAFTVASSAIGRDSLLLNAGFTLIFSPQFSAYAFYDGELARTNYQANDVMVGIRTSF